MADITPTVSTVGGDNKALLYKWEGFQADGDVGLPIKAINHSDRTVFMYGDWGSGLSMTMEGSPDGANWFPLTDPQGNPITKTADASEAVTELTVFIRPRAGAGSAADADIALLVKIP